ncbi:hypothetical protein VNO78_23088 [Psophocarpus tetragonolobus]|uniref:Uncharacterized protein n=1 Tax=Psophocarpus tetragonolobus TaxID=3891 RepID=A0AAN9XDA4_PSOTE
METIGVGVGMVEVTDEEIRGKALVKEEGCRGVDELQLKDRTVTHFIGDNWQVLDKGMVDMEKLDKLNMLTLCKGMEAMANRMAVMSMFTKDQARGLM